MIGRVCAAALTISGIVGAPPVTAPSVTTDIALMDFLSGSTDALVMGPTAFPDPADYPGFLSTVDQLYLDPLGFEGQSTALTTPETYDFGTSVTAGEQDLISAVTQQYDAGDFSAADPLTIFGYSQSAVLASLAEQQLADDGIPSNALRFVFVGDAASAEGGFLNTFIGSLPTADQPFAIELVDLLGDGSLLGATTPDNLYPTDVYTITNDGWSDWPSNVETSLSADYLAFTGTFQEHLEYLGLTPEMISSATQTVEGLTTYFTIADPTNAFETLLTALSNILS
jgi:PE-PPE domain